MKELPLRVNKATTLLWLQVRVQRDGDSQEGIPPEHPGAVSRDGVIVEDVDPAAVIRHGCSEVLQRNMTVRYEAADTRENELQDLESAQPSDLIQEFMKGHRGRTGALQEEPKRPFLGKSSKGGKGPFYYVTFSVRRA